MILILTRTLVIVYSTRIITVKGKLPPAAIVCLQLQLLAEVHAINSAELPIKRTAYGTMEWVSLLLTRA